MSPRPSAAATSTTRPCTRSAAARAWPSDTTATRQGLGLSLSQLNRIVEYDPRERRLTAEAGVTMSRIAETLGAAGQMLPVDVPQPGTATLGGVVAVQAQGPRVFGHGPLRHFVLGLQAVEGRGVAFRAGGSLAKGVAGPDVSRLLIGSLGTLGVITELTIRVRPAPQRTAVMACAPADLPEAERLLAAMPRSAVSPAAIELLWGAAWQDVAGGGGRSRVLGTIPGAGRSSRRRGRRGRMDGRAASRRVAGTGGHSVLRPR